MKVTSPPKCTAPPAASSGTSDTRNTSGDQAIPAAGGPRILLLSASVGAGHIRAADAIQSALTRLLPNATIAHVDALQMTNRLFRSVYGAGYVKAVSRAPHLVGALYDLLDRPTGTKARDRARSALEMGNFRRLARFARTQPWDLAVSTHFLPAALLAHLRRKRRIAFPLATVVTDFDVHGMWFTNPCDRLFVATDEARAVALASGLAPDRVVASGIPIDSIFAAPFDRQALCDKHGLRSDRPIVLQMAGGFGLGPVERIYRSIRDVAAPIQLVVIAGKNAAARARIERLGPHTTHDCKIIGFTREIHELMAVADLLVTKPGGLTTSEALARGCGMVVVDPIPGQEERNSDYLLENGAAVRVNNLAALTHKLNTLLSHPDRLTAMRAAARQISRPYAADAVARSAVELLSLTSPTTSGN